MLISLFWFLHHRLIETPREQKRGHWEALTWREWRLLDKRGA